MKYIHLILLFFYSSSLCGQINVTNVILNDKSKKQLYIGVDNILVISGTKHYSHVHFAANKMKAEIINDSTIILQPAMIGADTLRIYSANKLIYQCPFLVDVVPRPIVRIGNSLDTIMTVRQILQSPYLSIIFPNTNFNSEWHVLSYTSVITSSAEGDTFIEYNPSNKFTENETRHIAQLKSGDKIYFDAIRATAPDSQANTFKSFTVHIR